ncbi:MAG TPA: TetR/AcrR family transcriptional regulator [Saprospiraceae bacterium]|nr:TetR/AcrR family transcriptional regulator [Saprospiraceae bacterium]
MSVKLRFYLNETLYIKDPQDSKLGRKIIQYSVEIISQIGFEAFTFKKLAAEIHSTEASLYRYFENKHLLLLYLVNWYWEWVNYLITLNTMNIRDAKKKLEIVIRSLVFASEDNSLVEFINESKLHRIVVFEGAKAYHTIDIEKENSVGMFKSYKDLIAVISGIVLEVDPDFKYPHALASSLFEMANNQLFFARYLPKLTDVSSKKNYDVEVEKILNYFLNKLLF